MESQKQIQVLRRYLLDMSKLSHRAVDYAIKGYRLGSPEFCRHVRKGDGRLGELRQKITDLCHKLIRQDSNFSSKGLIHPPAVDSQARFPRTALRICIALHAAYLAAEELAHHAMLRLENVQTSSSESLEKLCFLVNRLMCLCIIALFKNESHYAETVLQNNELNRLFELVSRDLRSDIYEQRTMPIAIEQSIANSLKKIATQTQEIAAAIVFGLKGTTWAVESGATANL
jgi:phosphate uptake regulator